MAASPEPVRVSPDGVRATDQVASGSALLFWGQILGNAGILVALVLLTRALGPPGRGTIAFITVTSIVSARVTRLGVSEAAVVFAAQRPQSPSGAAHEPGSLGHGRSCRGRGNRLRSPLRRARLAAERCRRRGARHPRAGDARLGAGRRRLLVRPRLQPLRDPRRDHRGDGLAVRAHGCAGLGDVRPQRGRRRADLGRSPGCQGAGAVVVVRPDERRRPPEPGAAPRVGRLRHPRLGRESLGRAQRPRRPDPDRLHRDRDDARLLRGRGQRVGDPALPARRRGDRRPAVCGARRSRTPGGAGAQGVPIGCHCVAVRAGRRRGRRPPAADPRLRGAVRSVDRPVPAGSSPARSATSRSASSRVPWLHRRGRGSPPSGRWSRSGSGSSWTLSSSRRSAQRVRQSRRALRCSQEARRR